MSGLQKQYHLVEVRRRKYLENAPKISLKVINQLPIGNKAEVFAETDPFHIQALVGLQNEYHTDPTEAQIIAYAEHLRGYLCDIQDIL